MKYYMQIVVLLSLLSVSIAGVTPRNKFEEGLLTLIEKCKNGDVQSLPIPFPSLKPLKVPPMEFTYDGFTVSLSEVKIKGMENLAVRKLSASPSDLTLSMEIVIPTLAIRADRYHLRGSVWFYTIDNKGIFKCKINNLRAQASIQFGAEGNDTVITDLNLDYTVDDIEAHLSGSSGLVNSGFNKRVSKLLNDNEMTERIENAIIDLTSTYLRGHTPQEFVEIISAK